MVKEDKKEFLPVIPGNMPNENKEADGVIYSVTFPETPEAKYKRMMREAQGRPIVPTCQAT